MKLPLWLIALLFAGYTVWCVNYWHCYKCQCCDGAAPTEEAPAQTTGVPLFKWNADRPVADANFPTWKKNLLATGGQGDTLVITGFYRAHEANGEQLALARAAVLRDMMKPEMPDSRVRLEAKLVEDGLSETSDPMESASFNWVKMVLKKEDSAIIETDRDVILLFPFNSTEKDHNPAVDAYLKKMCEKHKTTRATFRVVGHTDDVGTEEDNVKLGMGRAKAVAKILMDNGIASERIQVDSKGEAEPVASNDNDDGRHQNRRVIITVNL